jgi:hypothetical protein
MDVAPPVFVMYEPDKGCLIAKGAGAELCRLSRMSGMAKGPVIGPLGFTVAEFPIVVATVKGCNLVGGLKVWNGPKFLRESAPYHITTSTTRQHIADGSSGYIKRNVGMS